jgi:hypothetical protein
MKRNDAERRKELEEQGAAAHRRMSELIARGEARRQARREAEERRRARLRRLTFGLLGR